MPLLLHLCSRHSTRRHLEVFLVQPPRLPPQAGRSWCLCRPRPLVSGGTKSDLPLPESATREALEECVDLCRVLTVLLLAGESHNCRQPYLCPFLFETCRVIRSARAAPSCRGEQKRLEFPQITCPLSSLPPPLIPPSNPEFPHQVCPRHSVLETVRTVKKLL